MATYTLELGQEPKQKELEQGEIDILLWQETGKKLGKRYAATNWDVADWLLEGSHYWPQDVTGSLTARYGISFYTVTSSILGISRGMCEDYLSVARAYPSKDDRVSGLSMGHHQSLISAPDVERLKLLQKAQRYEWTISRLRSEAQELGLVKVGAYANGPERTLRGFKVPTDNYKILSVLAEDQGVEVTDLAAQILVEYTNKKRRSLKSRLE